jgi:hypothetical protein
MTSQVEADPSNKEGSSSGGWHKDGFLVEKAPPSSPCHHPLFIPVQKYLA